MPTVAWNLPRAMNSSPSRVSLVGRPATNQDGATNSLPLRERKTLPVQNARTPSCNDVKNETKGHSNHSRLSKLHRITQETNISTTTDILISLTSTNSSHWHLPACVPTVISVLLACRQRHFLSKAKLVRPTMTTISLRVESVISQPPEQQSHHHHQQHQHPHHDARHRRHRLKSKTRQFQHQQVET